MDEQFGVLSPGMMELTLPFPPSVNNFQINVSVRRRVDSPQYRNWKLEATRSMMQQYPAVTPIRPVFAESVRVTYLFSAPDKRRRDLSNYFKCVDDFMVNYGILKDDSLIHKLSAEWTKKGNGVFIRVEKIT